jgi:hypothetical protein
LKKREREEVCGMGWGGPGVVRQTRFTIIWLEEDEATKVSVETANNVC